MSLCVQTKAQRILAFDKRGKVKRVKYYEGNLIKLKLLSGEILQGDLTQIADSSFKLGIRNVKLDSVKIVYNTQKLLGFKLAGKIFMTAGTAYFAVASFNRTINNDSPVFSESSVKTSGLLLGAGIICKLIAKRPYRISKKRPLKILDLTI